LRFNLLEKTSLKSSAISYLFSLLFILRNASIIFSAAKTYLWSFYYEFSLEIVDDPLSSDLLEN
jgi:hypothetical protein